MPPKADAATLKKLILELKSKPQMDIVDSKADLFESGHLDSYGTVQLILSFEATFGIIFDFSDLNAQNFKNIDSISNLLVSKYGRER
ncbi:MAG: phosphopantetheine-binding protein [Bdellovibrionales bacterium]